MFPKKLLLLIMVHWRLNILYLADKLYIIFLIIFYQHSFHVFISFGVSLLFSLFVLSLINCNQNFTTFKIIFYFPQKFDLNSFYFAFRSSKMPLLDWLWQCTRHITQRLGYHEKQTISNLY